MSSSVTVAENDEWWLPNRPPALALLIRLFETQAKHMKEAAHAQLLSESKLDPNRNKQQCFYWRTLTGNLVEGGEKGNSSSSRSSGWSQWVPAVVNTVLLICYVFLKKENWGRTQTPQAHTEVSYEYLLLLFLKLIWSPPLVSNSYINWFTPQIRILEQLFQTISINELIFKIIKI